MGNYGNNMTALVTGGTLIYVDESTSEQTATTEFDEASIASVEVFLAEFGVDGTYQPGILNRAIEAIPHYVQDDAVIGGVQRHRSPRLQIKVPNSASNGILPSEFEPNQTISIPPRKGAAARAFQLARIVKHTGVWVTYELH